MLKKSVIGLFVFLFAIFTSGTAFAQADKAGIDLRVGLEVPYFIGAGINSDLGGDSSISVSGLKAVGVGVDLKFGYRWSYFGVALEQQIGGIFRTNGVEVSASETSITADGYKDGAGFFMGATYFLMTEFIPVTSDWLITIGEGLGAMYGAKLDKGRLFPSADSDAAFAFKIDLGLTYFLFSKYGLGINIEYAGALSFGDGVSFAQAIVPSLTYSMVF